MTVGGGLLLNPVIRAEFQQATGAVIRFVDNVTALEMGLPWQDSGLDVSFSVTLHVQPQPHTSTFSVRGLSRERRQAIKTGWRQAQQLAFQTRSQLQAGILRVTAGYEQEYGKLFEHQIMRVEDDARGDSLSFECQDGRVAWENSFVTTSLPGGADLSVVQDVIQAANSPGIQSDEDFVAAFTKALPDYQLGSGNVTGSAELGLVLLGQTKDAQTNINDTLGLKQFWQNGRPVTLTDNAATFDEAVLLGGPGGAGLLDVATLDMDGLRGPGWAQVKTLLIPRLTPGRQVLLRNDDGSPRDGGLFRVDSVTHSGVKLGSDWTSTCVLRPTSLL